MPCQPNNHNNNNNKEEQSEVDSQQVVYERTQTDALNRRLLCSFLDSLNRNDSVLQSMLSNGNINNSDNSSDTFN